MTAKQVRLLGWFGMFPTAMCIILAGVVTSILGFVLLLACGVWCVWCSLTLLWVADHNIFD